MATNRRRAIATSTTGAGLTVAGGVLRQQGIQAAHGGHPPAWKLRHPLATHQTRALVRAGARGRSRYLLGATLGLVGAPALAVGLHDTVARKRDDRPSFVREGLRGTQDALEQRAEGIKEVPPQHRTGPLAVSAGAGLAGSLAAHRALDRARTFRGTHHSGRAGIAALGGATAAAVSYPLARHTVRSSEYEVTPAGVRRRKTRPVRPSSKASNATSRPRSLTADMSKVLNPHSLTPTTSRGTPRKVHWRNGADDHAVCGLDGAFGRGTGPFAEHYGEITCNGCARLMRIRKDDLDDVRRRRSPAEAHRTKYRRLDEIFEDFHEKIGEPLIHFKTEGIIRPREELSRHMTGKVACGSEVARHVTEKHHEVTCPECLKRIRRGFGVVKASGDYAGRHTSTRAQRAAIFATGTTPIVGGVAGARAAGHFAPPGQRRKTEARQYGLTTAGSLVGGAGGAYGTAALASRHRGVNEAATRAAAMHTRASEKVRSFKPVNATLARLPKGGRATARVARAKQIAAGSRIAAPLRRSPIAAGAGYVAGKTIGGYAGSGLAMRHNQGDQREYNLRHPVAKSVDNMTVAERRKLSRKKRVAAASSTVTGLAGLGALGARMTHRPELGVKLLTGGAAIGGPNSLNFAGVLRREAKAQNPDVKKAAPTSRRAHELATSFARKGKLVEQRRALTLRGRLVAIGKAERREPLTRMHAGTAHQIVRRYGDAGTLPKELSREDRMRAYEARYVHAGGHKAEHWQRRADAGDKVKTGGLAGATLGGAGILALRHPKVVARLGNRLGHARHAVDSATIGAATVSGAGELYAGHARRRRASYSNSKAGVAASALRRMRDYQS